MAFFKGASLLRRHYEYRADQYGINLLHDNRGAVSYFTNNMIQESLLFVHQTGFHKTYQLLPHEEQAKVLQHIAKSYGSQFQAGPHPSSWDRYALAEKMISR